MSRKWNTETPAPRTCARHMPGDASCDERCGDRLAVAPAPREVGPADAADMASGYTDESADNAAKDKIAYDLGELE